MSNSAGENKARENILSRLRAGAKGASAPLSDFTTMEERRWSPEERRTRLIQKMSIMNTEVHRTTAEDWPDVLHGLMQAKGLGSLLLGEGTWADEALKSAWGESSVLSYCESEPKDFKRQAFAAQASLATSIGGIADVGAIAVIPTPAEPRMLTLAPPINFILLREGEIRDSLWSFQKEENWRNGLPTNLVLISGPSKTADIEQELTYGVHGPKELIVLVI